MNEVRTQVLIIGAGPGGYVAAIRLAQLGRKAIVVDKERVGGICLNWGCIPTKALLHAVHTIRLAREGAVMGIQFAEPQIDTGKLGLWRTRIVDRLVRGTEYLLKQSGAELIAAAAEFTDPRRVRLNRPDGKVTQVEADQIIVATGSEPSVLPGLEPDGRQIITSNEAVSLSSVPARLLVIGAGAIGLEFASIYAGLGSQVTVVEIMDQVLPGSDRELSELLERALRKQGIRTRLGTKVAGIQREIPLKVSLSPLQPTGPNSASETLEVDQVLVAVGRRPRTSGLGIENSGLRLDRRGYIAVNERLEAIPAAVYAIGDVARPPLLAHKASREGIVVAETIAGLWSDASLRAVPNCVFTDPELAAVGLTEEEAIAQGYEIEVGRVPVTALGRPATLNRTDGVCKIVADRKTDRILGVHILAPDASSLISEGVLAVEQGLTSTAVGTAIHPHPTMSELVMEAAEAVHRRAIHILNPRPAG